MAAQNCRKRKIDQIAQLERQVEEARVRKRQLINDREELYRQREEWASRLTSLEADILQGMSKSSKEFRLDLSSPDAVRVVSRRSEANAIAPAPATSHSQVRHYDKEEAQVDQLKSLLEYYFCLFQAASRGFVGGAGAYHHHQGQFMWKHHGASGTKPN